MLIQTRLDSPGTLHHVIICGIENKEIDVWKRRVNARTLKERPPINVSAYAPLMPPKLHNTVGQAYSFSQSVAPATSLG